MPDRSAWLITWRSFGVRHRAVFHTELPMGTAVHDDGVRLRGRGAAPLHCVLQARSDGRLWLFSYAGLAPGADPPRRVLEDGGHFRIGRRAFGVSRLASMPRRPRTFLRAAATGLRGVALLAFAAVGLAIASDTSSGRPPDVANALTSHDPVEVAAALGAEGDVQLVEALRRALAPGSGVGVRDLGADPRLRTVNGYRVETHDLEVTSPGQPPRTVTLDVTYGLVDGEWKVISAVPAGRH